MKRQKLKKSDRVLAVARRLGLASAIVLAGAIPAVAQGGPHFQRGNLVVSRSVYDNNANTVQVGMILPPNCAVT